MSNNINKNILIIILSSVLFLTNNAFGKEEKKFKAITTFTVIADMAKNVAGDFATVESITKPGAEIHGYSPTPRDILRAQDADLILWNGLNLEIWFKQFYKNLEKIPSITLSDRIAPMGINEGTYKGKPNPHAWMSQENAMIYIDNIVEGFSKYDPKNANVYFRNGQKYKEKIMVTIQPLKEIVLKLPENKRWLVSCEGAFSYLARDFKLKELYLWPINAEQQGTPQQVRKVIDGVNNNNIKVIFCESTVNNDPAKQVARETSANYGGFLYVDSLSKPDGPVPTYLELLRVTSETIVLGLLGNKK